MRTPLFVLLSLLLCARPPELLAQGGKLQKARAEVRNPPAAKKDTEDKEDDDTAWSLSLASDDDETCEGGWLADGLGGLCWLIGVTLFKGPAWSVGDTWEGSEHRFLRYPYAERLPGAMWLAPCTELPGPDPEGQEWRGLPATDSSAMVPAPKTRGWAGRFSLGESNDFDGLNRVNGLLLLEGLHRFGVQVGWNYLTEQLADNQQDSLWLGDATATFRFAQTEKVQLRTGLGLRWLADRTDSDFGVNFLYAGDFYPVAPLVLSTSLELGSLGEAFVCHGRVTAGLLLKRWELFGGYDWLRIGSVDLQGPVLGLRLWF